MGMKPGALKICEAEAKASLYNISKLIASASKYKPPVAVHEAQKRASYPCLDTTSYEYLLEYLINKNSTVQNGDKR